MLRYIFPPAQKSGPIDRSDFGPYTTANQVVEFFKDEIKGKTIIITGASPNSLGAECAISLAAASPKTIILAGRSEAKTAKTASAITTKYPTVEIKTLLLDLASLKSCRTAAEEVLSWQDVPHVDVLICNAAIMATPYRKTEDGFESQFGTNYVGHFVFTMGILKKILAAKTEVYSPRIVNVSSAEHRSSGIRFDDVGFSDGKTYEKWTAYGQSKTANMLSAISLAEKLSQQGVVAVSLDPGGINTNLAQHLGVLEIVSRLISSIKASNLKLKTLQAGAATHVVAAFDPTLMEHNGEYLVDCVPTKPSKEWAEDKEAATRLWKLTESLVQETYNV